MGIHFFPKLDNKGILWRSLYQNLITMYITRQFEHFLGSNYQGKKSTETWSYPTKSIYFVPNESLRILGPYFESGSLLLWDFRITILHT